MPFTPSRSNGVDVGILLAGALLLASCGAALPRGVDAAEPDPADAGPDTIAPDSSSPVSRDAIGLDEALADAAVDATQEDANACGATLPVVPFRTGFSALLPADTARVAAATGNELELAFEQGATVKFVWPGPPLPFAAGEPVRLAWICRGQLSSNGCWNVVRNDRASAAVWSETGSSAGGAPGPLALPGAPGIGLARACGFEAPSWCSGAPPPRATIFDLMVAWEGNETVVPVGATRAIGPWSLTNVIASASSGTQGPTCAQDGGYAVVATWLGPP
jgi:hypothetical protein